MSQDMCPSCGRPIDEHDRHVRFGLPHPVLQIPESERADRTWGHDPLLQVEGAGAFVRVLLPIRLTGGYALTIGTWLGIHPTRLSEVWQLWETPAYAEIVLDGRLANPIPPWGEAVLGAPARASVRDPAQWPYIGSSDEATLRAILSTEWPHDDVLAAYASVL